MQLDQPFDELDLSKTIALMPNFLQYSLQDKKQIKTRLVSEQHRLVCTRSLD